MNNVPAIPYCSAIRLFAQATGRKCVTLKEFQEVRQDFELFTHQLTVMNEVLFCSAISLAIVTVPMLVSAGRRRLHVSGTGKLYAPPLDAQERRLLRSLSWISGEGCIAVTIGRVCHKGDPAQFRELVIMLQEMIQEDPDEVLHIIGPRNFRRVMRMRYDRTAVFS